jgi:hypothetical protein
VFSVFWTAPINPTQWQSYSNTRFHSNRHNSGHFLMGTSVSPLGASVCGVAFIRAADSPGLRQEKLIMTRMRNDDKSPMTIGKET